MDIDELSDGRIVARRSPTGRWQCSIAFGFPEFSRDLDDAEFSSTFGARAVSAIPKRAAKVVTRLLEDDEVSGERTLTFDRYIDLTASPTRRKIERCRIAHRDARRARLEADLVTVDTATDLLIAGWSHRDTTAALSMSRSVLFELIEHADVLEKEIEAMKDAYEADVEYAAQSRDDAETEAAYRIEQDAAYRRIGGAEAAEYFESVDNLPPVASWKLPPRIALGPVCMFRSDGSAEFNVVDCEQGD